MITKTYSVQFYRWFKKIGGNTQDLKINLAVQIPTRSLIFSSFKANPDHVKKTYNHKFKHHEQYNS